MATADYFLKLDGIEGESTDAKHKGEIQIESFSFSESQSGTGSGGGSGKVRMGDFHFVIQANKASPRLFLSCASGEPIKNAVLTCRKAGGSQQEYLKITMSDALVSAFQLNGSSHAAIIPVEQFSLSFAKIEYEYKPQQFNGLLGPPVKTGWSLKENRPV